MLPWLLRVRKLPGVKARAYVDDLTAWATGARAVEFTHEIVRITQLFEACTSLKLHDGKCRRFANAPVLRTELRSMEGPLVSEWFKDLGVIKNVGKTRTKGPMRLEGAIARVQRVCKLSLPLHKKAYIVTASGIPAAVYGQASNLVAVSEIRKLRTAIKRCLVKKDKFASQEPLFRAWVSAGGGTREYMP